ncbi:hypothetical protein QUA27_25450 [Microcoleus sp. Pol14C6]|uniref:hypothetical protein n=1 Tax=unclassified Microcoleus TaxID=2642155 RepID=UPI002FCECADC
MATEKKHIAVYLDKAVEDALTKFCTANELQSKKGPMYSAAVNRALAEYFGIASSTPSKLPVNTPHHTPSTIPDNTLAQRLAEIEERQAKQDAEMEELRGKLAA